MAPKVLVPYDGSDGSAEAVMHALETFPDAETTVLHVIDRKLIEAPYGQMLVGDEELRERAEEAAEGILSEAEDIAEEDGTEIKTDVVVGHPVRDILRYAEENEMDQIVLGGKGLSNVPSLLLGSVSFGVVLHAEIPVTVVR